MNTKIMNDYIWKLFLVALVGIASPSAFSDTTYSDFKVTHGPILGRPGPTTMSIWVRTNFPGEVSVRYGTERFKQMMVSDLSLIHI